MKTKKEREKIIKSLFDKIRKEIVVKSELSLIRLQNLESMESDAIKENSEKAVSRIRKFVREKELKMYKLKSIGKKYTVKNGEIVSVTPLK